MSEYLSGRARGGSCPCKQDPDKRGRMDSFGFVVVLKVILRLFHQFLFNFWADFFILLSFYVTPMSLVNLLTFVCFYFIPYEALCDFFFLSRNVLYK